jgi:NAD(P)-dependent dehydrogenase (short-subunit alcohol dehydrogenase family)
MGQLNLDQPVSQNQYASFTAYCDSKLANILFTYELSRRLELTSITVNCLHPGVIASSFGNTGSGVLKWVFKLARPFMKTSEQGAATVVYLATSAEVSGVSGKYFKNLKPVNSSKQSYNTHIARRLWSHSEVQTGLATEL